MSLLQALHLPPLPARGAGKGAPADKTVASAAKKEQLSKAAEFWRDTHGQANARIASLKTSVKAHYAGGHPELHQQIDVGLAKLDGVLDTVDHRLAEALVHAGEAPDDAARKAALAEAKAILTEYINYVKSEPLVAHIDGNPFGVKTELRTLIATGLTNAAKAIG